MKVFPILYQGIKRKPEWPVGVKWHDAQYHKFGIEQNHGQSLDALAERGGLSPRELFAGLAGIKLNDLAALPATDADAMEEMQNWPVDWEYARSSQSLDA